MNSFDLSPLSRPTAGFDALNRRLDDALDQADNGYSLHNADMSYGDIAKTAAEYVRLAGRVWRPRDTVVALSPPTSEELRGMVGCVDHDEAEQHRHLSLLEAGLRHRHPSMTDNQVDAAVARVTRAMSPPAPPNDAEWESIRRHRAEHLPALSTISMSNRSRTPANPSGRNVVGVEGVRDAVPIASGHHDEKNNRGQSGRTVSSPHDSGHRQQRRLPDGLKASADTQRAMGEHRPQRPSVTFWRHAGGLAGRSAASGAGRRMPLEMPYHCSRIVRLIGGSWSRRLGQAALLEDIPC